MNLLFFNEVIKSDVAAAIAWTLLHSTWQGMLAAIVAGLIVIFTKKQTASVRYRLYTCVFLLFLLTVSITFTVQYNNQLATNTSTASQVTAMVASVTEKPNDAIASLPGINGVNTLIKQTAILLHQYYPALFSIWLLVFASKLFFMLTGFRSMNRLRQEAAQPADLHWQNLVNRLSLSLGIQSHIQLLESARIKVPMMTGFFKPVILVPLGICCHLPPAEMEAILLHELAHIRRSDYLMNLLQRLMETVFFFNPCMLWVSSLMRDERENCCDDIAVEVIKNKEQYIHALVAFQEYNLAYHRIQALAFAGSRQRLLYRVKRLLINENKKLNHMEKMILVCSLVVLTAAFSISSGTVQAQDRNKPLRESQRRESAESRNSRTPDREIIDEENRFEHLSTINSDNNGRRTTTITATDQYGTRYVLRKTDGRINKLTINNKEIDENDFPEYRSIIEKIEAGNAKNNISGRNKYSNSNNNENIEREMELSKEAELMARQRHVLEADLARQHRALELRNRRNELENEDRDLIEERTALKLRKQRDIGMEDDARREQKEMQLHQKLAKERHMRGQHEMQLHQQLAQERLNNEQQLLQQHKKMIKDRIGQDEKISREHHERIMEEQHEAEYRNKANSDQLRKALTMEKIRNQNNNRNNSIHEELRGIDHERIARERQLQTERKMALRKSALEQHNNKNLNRLRSNLRNGNDNDEIHSILETLDEEGVIEDQENVSFTLNDEELIVNGRRQSNSLHEQLRERYIHSRGDTFIYEKNGNSTKTTINRNR